jgi:hypothetical protein
MRALEAGKLLDRTLEALPSDMEMQERGRAGRGLTRPELAVLLSYAKIALQHELLESAVPDEPSSSPGSPAISRRCCASALPAISPSTACAGRSSRWGSPTPSSTAAARPMAVRLADETRRTSADVAYAFLPRARCSSCRRCGSASMRSTARPRATPRSASIRRRATS